MTDSTDTSVEDVPAQTPADDAVAALDVESARQPDPRDIARAVAMEVAEEDEQVGACVAAIDMGDGVTDFRLAANIRGYEGWQWSVTLYHDVEVGTWTVNESSLIPTEDALMPPAWIPWKDRLEPTDLAPTDSIGTDPDDPRLEEGFRRTESAEAGATEEDSSPAEKDGDDSAAAAQSTNETSADADADAEIAQAGQGHADDDETDANADLDEAVEEFDLSRRHVLSPLGRAQTAKRWYEGPRGPKAMSTKTASGNLCSTCGFFVPLKGDLNLLFGVCANKWSPDDGRVVSLDHGCGEHSEIEPPEASRLWVQSKPAFDDLHIDVIAQKPRDERAQVELIEQLDGTSGDGGGKVDEAELATEEDIEENTELDAESAEVQEHIVEAGDEPELETVVSLAESDEVESEDETDEAESDENESDETESNEDEADGTESDESETDETDPEESDEVKSEEAETTESGDTESEDETDESPEPDAEDTVDTDTEPDGTDSSDVETNDTDSSDVEHTDH